MRLNINIFTTAIILLVLMPLQAMGAETAASVMEKCAAKVSKAPALSFKFTLRYGDEMSLCDITIAKEKFHLSSPTMQVWYDGTTQWTYSSANKELSITEPTADELMECNPFAILNHYSRAYNARRVNADGLQIELTPKKKTSNIRKAVVSIDPATYYPEKMVVTLTNGRVFTVSVGSVSVSKAVSSSFIYDKRKYPASEIIDLR